MRDYSIKNSFSDIEIKCSDNKILYYSKFILIQYEYFEKMITSGMQETVTNNVNIPFTSETVNIIFNKIQHCEPEIIEIDTIIEVIKLCHMYMLDKFLEYYDKLLSEKIKTINDTRLSGILLTANDLQLTVTKKTILHKFTSGEITSYKDFHPKIIIISVNTIEAGYKWLMDNDVKNDPRSYYMILVFMLQKLAEHKCPREAENLCQFYITGVNYLMKGLIKLKNPELSQKIINKLIS